MNLYHLRYFVTLAHLEHYTKASEQLAITQPSLSHAISSLEKELKVRLFEKDGRNVVLTKCGKSFLKDVEEILSILDFSVANLQMTGSGEGTMDIAFVRTLGAWYIPDLLRSFLDEHPDKRVKFRLHNGGGLSANIIKGLKERKYDVAFCSKYNDDPLIDFVPITNQQLVVIVPNDHPLADRTSVALKDTLPYPQIVFDPRSGLRSIVDSLFEEIGEYPKPVMEIEEDQVIAGLVAQDFGIAVVPKMHILDTLPVKILEISEPKPQRNFYMASLKGTYAAPLVNEFKQFAIEHSKDRICEI